MKVEIVHKGDSAEIRIWGFPDEDAEEILDAIRRVFCRQVAEEE